MMNSLSTAKSTDSATNTLFPLLAEGEPSPYTLVKGTSPIIFLAPHSGKLIPKSLYDEDGLPLGLDPEFFNTRHEACDLGTQTLIELLSKSGQGHNCLSTNYSRLVCDLNRLKKDSIFVASSEHDDQKIPGNINLSNEQRQQRYDALYTPYQAALKKLIRQTREKHGYAVIIDLHSFTPTWKGKGRSVDIGTISHNTNPIERATVKSLSATSQTAGLSFVKNAPYDHTKITLEYMEPILFIEHCGASYIGIETKNTLLQTPEALAQVTNIIIRCAEHLMLLSEQILELQEKSAYCSTNVPSSKDFLLETPHQELQDTRI